MGDKMFVSEEWDVAFVDEEAGRMARLLEFGSQITPKFELISRARAFLLSIFPKYEEDMSIYLLAKELYGV